MGGRADYEERRKKRIERYEKLSKKAREMSEQYSNSNANRILQIASGQPILVGHHSEKKHRKLIERAHNDIRKSIEESDKSKYYNNRVKSIENSKVIYNDDPEAIKKLEDKLERLKNEKESIKAREHEQYELNNIGANIRETKKRIERLKELETIEFKTIEFNGGKVIHNQAINRIQFIFNEMPNEEVRSCLKSYGFHWSRQEQAWQREFNQNCIRATNRIMENILENDKKHEEEEFE